MESESEWRRLVWEVGWGGSGIELVARLQVPFGSRTHIAVSPLSGGRWLFTGTLGTSGYVDQWHYYGFYPRTGFPYEWDVLPD